MTAVPSNSAIKEFLESQGDLSLLQHPVDFGRSDKWEDYCCFVGASWAAISPLFALIPLWWFPIETFRGRTLAQHYSLKMDSDGLSLSAAYNPYCCRITHYVKRVELTDVKDVRLEEGYCLQRFGLKKLCVDAPTAATVHEFGPEIQAAFLPHPEQAAEAIRLAVRRRKGLAAPGAVEGMVRAPPAGGAEVVEGLPVPSGVAERVQALVALVARGALTPEEAASIRVAVLAAEQDPLARLADAANSRDRQRISQEEYGQVKAALVAQLTK